MELSPTFKPNIERLTRHLNRTARERNFETCPDSLREVQSYLKQELVSYGLEVEKFPFSFQGQTFSNLIARLPGNLRRPRLIVGAHFDAVPGSPGADDNASGVACLLEAARVYAEAHKTHPGVGGEPRDRSAVNASVEFAAFNIEEYGMIGSQAYARKLKCEGIPVRGMFSLEMVGYTSPEKGSQRMPLFLKPFYPDVGNFIGLVANTQSRQWLKEVKNIFKTVTDLPVESLVLPANGWVFPDARLSDHSPFWDEGFPALLVTDTSFFRNPYYHTDRDRVETLDLDFLAKVTEATIRTALLAGGAGRAGTD